MKKRGISSLPTNTVVSKKFKPTESVIQPDVLLIAIIDGKKVTKTRCPVYNNNIVSLPAMIEVFADLVICRKCQKGELRLFELRNLSTCSTQLIFRCNNCLEAKIFMNVPIRAVPNPLQIIFLREDLLSTYYPATLASLVVGIGTEKLNTLYGLLDIPPSPTAQHKYKILKNLRETAELVARKCMDKAKEELRIKFEMLAGFTMQS